MKSIKCKIAEGTPAQCMYRRLQLNDQQAERQKKNLLQRTMTFVHRARELMVQDWMA